MDQRLEFRGFYCTGNIGSPCCMNRHHCLGHPPPPPGCGIGRLVRPIPPGRLLPLCRFASLHIVMSVGRDPAGICRTWSSPTSPCGSVCVDFGWTLAVRWVCL